MNIVKNQNQNFISATELHVELGIKRDYSTWIKQSIERAELEQIKDFTILKGKSTGGRPTINYLLTRDAALTVIMMSGGRFASKLRKDVIELYNQHDTGLAFTAPQIESLIDLSKSMTLISIQKDVERKHFDLYNNEKTWYDYRANLLGYSKESLYDAMRAVNKKYRSMRESLLKLDANELIRSGVVDLLIAMGKTEEYSINVGNLCKSIAEKMELKKDIWDDTKPNPLQLNAPNVEMRKNMFYNTQLKLKE